MDKKFISGAITAILCFAFALSAAAQTNAPSITSLKPTSGFVGSRIVIEGTGFTSTGNKIKFGNLGSENNPRYNFNSPDNKTIIFNVPSSNYYSCWDSTPKCLVPVALTQPGTYGVSVVNANGTSNEVSFTVKSLPLKKVCTQEVKQCPNGSYVSHVGPNCEFAECPGTENKPGLRKNIQDVKTYFETKIADIKSKKEALDIQLKNNIDVAKKRLETAREEAKKAAEMRRANLKDKISKLKDENKKQIATRLNEQLSHLNTQWTDHFNNMLDRLSEILVKIESRADKAQATGKDVSSVRTAIASAKTAIENARMAVTDQAKKTYIADFNSETQLGTAFKVAKEQLKKDLFGLRDGAMKSAREAVANALQALKIIPSINEELQATTTTASKTQQ